MKTVIIEVRGGVVPEIYSDTEDLRAVLVDWDTDQSPDEPYSGGDFPIQPIGKLPEETMSAVLSPLPAS